MPRLPANKGGLMMPNHTMQRIVRFVRRRGLVAIPGTLITHTWRSLFANYHLCFSMSGESFKQSQFVPGLKIVRCDNEGEIAPDHLEQIFVEEGPESISQLRQNFTQCGILWLGLIDQSVVAYQFSRRGCNTTRYLVNLRPEDLVIYATMTFAKWRGRGINPAMMQYIVEKELAGRGTAYVNCKGWNKASIRGILKAGFKPLGRYDHEIEINAVGAVSPQ